MDYQTSSIRPNYEVRNYRRDEETEITQLSEQVFSRPISLETWNWKYRDSPYGGEATVGVYDNKIVAHYGGLVLDANHYGKPIYLLHAVDSMCAPKSRASLIFVRVGSTFIDSLASRQIEEFGFGFPGKTAAKLGILKLGYRFHSSIYTAQVATNQVKSRFSLNSWTYIENPDKHYFEKVDSIWKTAKNKIPVGVKKDSDYISWRYDMRPGKKYSYWILMRLGKLLAYAITTRENGLIRILDFVSIHSMQSPGEHGEFSSLVACIAKQPNAESVSFWITPAAQYRNRVAMSLNATIEENECCSVYVDFIADSFNKLTGGDSGNFVFDAGDYDLF